VVIVIDFVGIVFYWNCVVEDFYGWMVEEVVGCLVLELMLLM